MKIKLIVSDIDHTILPGFGHVSPLTRETVRRCRAQGTEFVVCSGRWFPAARLIAADELGIEDGIMICCNGCAIIRTDGTILKEYCMSNEQAQEIYEILKDAGVMMTAYVRGAIYRIHTQYLEDFWLPEKSSYFGGKEYRVVDNDEAAFCELGMKSPYKMEAYSNDPEKLNVLRRKLLEKGFWVNSSFPVNMEITAQGAGKGTATRWLWEYLDAKESEVMGFGDYYNDLPMLENVGWPVAVGNACEAVKRAAKLIAPNCEDDGVAKVIRQYILGDEEL